MQCVLFIVFQPEIECMGPLRDIKAFTTVTPVQHLIALDAPCFSFTFGLIFWFSHLVIGVFYFESVLDDFCLAYSDSSTRAQSKLMARQLWHIWLEQHHQLTRQNKVDLVMQRITSGLKAALHLRNDKEKKSVNSI